MDSTYDSPTRSSSHVSRSPLFVAGSPPVSPCPPSSYVPIDSLSNNNNNNNNMASGKCCQCDEPRATCTRCSCARNSKPCSSCRPGERGLCQNIPSMDSTSDSPTRSPSHVSCSPSFVTGSPPVSPCPPFSYVPMDSLSPHLSTASGSMTGHYLDDSEVDSMLLSAYGATLCRSTAMDDNVWYSRWKTVTQLSGNHYFLPKGQCGRRYIAIMTEEINLLSRGTYPSERVIVFGSVILQRDKFIRNTRDIDRNLNRRMDLWSQNNFDLLVQEALRCDHLLKSRRRHQQQNTEHIERVFTRLMLSGKVRAAMRWLTERSKGHVLLPSDSVSMSIDNSMQSMTVIEALKYKHPPNHPSFSSTLSPSAPLPLLEDVDVSGTHVALTAKRLQGSAGPGGCDSSHWQDILLRFGSNSRRLCDAVAGLARSLVNSVVEWSQIQALMANRIIALDKSPSIRPIGVGESLRRVIGKVICLITRDDAQTTCGTSQLCAGIKCGMEGAIHTASELFETSDESHGMLVIDATNAFNSINRVSLLWNVRVLWPRASRFIFNTYRGWAPLVVRGSEDVLFSREGIIQGDPLSMFLYAIATLPLIEQTQLNSIKQLWYADDASALGSLPLLLLWFEKLQRVGPSFGYFPEPSKCSVIVKESMVDHASSMFEGTGVKVVTSCRFLGGVIGDHSGKVSFVMQKVREWSHSVQLLASVSKKQPQAAFIAFTKSLQLEWTFLQRVVSDCGSLLTDIEDTIISDFIPSLFGHDCNSLDRQLFSLPLRMGGLVFSFLPLILPCSLILPGLPPMSYVQPLLSLFHSTLQTMTVRSYKPGLTILVLRKTETNSYCPAY